jgi:phage recombination protein Bet
MTSTALATLTSKLAATLNMGNGAGLMETLKATAFKSQTQVTDAQMTALLVVANQYGLNPWTKEIYAFPDRNNGIVPVVGVDGWSRIINSHPQFDGMDFEQDAESCTCIIHRKDRSHPVKVTEYMAECRRANVGPWTSHPRRMLRHKAMIQCARLAFGYGGIYDQDEAERIVEVKTVDPATGEILIAPTFDLEAALADVACCRDEANLSAAWKQHVALAQAAKDKTGYAALKAAVAERGAAIKNQPQDVEAKEVANAND